MCGITTGGKEECFWDCDIIILEEESTVVNVFETGQRISNPECLKDCFEETPCVGMLLDDPDCTEGTASALRDKLCIQSVYKQQRLSFSVKEFFCIF